MLTYLSSLPKQKPNTELLEFLLGSSNSLEPTTFVPENAHPKRPQQAENSAATALGAHVAAVTSSSDVSWYKSKSGLRVRL